MKDEIKKELEEAIIEITKQIRTSATDLSVGCELREDCAAISILVDTLLRLEDGEDSEN